jgi:transcription elongation GreA/GreB family factor
MLPDKRAVHAALLESMRTTLATVAGAAKDAAKGATHEENRSEGDKDMRATEQSYIARGQAIRAEELADQLGRLEQMEVVQLSVIAAGALVRVSVEEEEHKLFYVLPFGGGTELDIDGVKIVVVTPISPVGKALLGRREGDDFELAIKGAKREWIVEELA